MLTLFQTSKDKLNKHIDDVKTIFNAVGVVHIPFYIAGGSVHSILKGLDDYDDVDVFFYSMDDAIIVTTALNNKYDELIGTNIAFLANVFVTKNALTFDKSMWSLLFGLNIDTKFQFITKHANTVEEMFKLFDLNSSCFAFTSNYKIVNGTNLNDYITVDFKNFKVNTLSRFVKYIVRKKCIDNDNIILSKIIDYLIENFYNIIPGSLYDGVEDMYNGCDILKTNIDILNINSVYIEMCKRFKNEELIIAFKTLDVDFKLNDACVEYIVYALEFDERSNAIINDGLLHEVLFISNFPDDKIKLARSTYPEYFI